MSGFDVCLVILRNIRICYKLKFPVIFPSFIDSVLEINGSKVEIFRRIKTTFSSKLKVSFSLSFDNPLKIECKHVVWFHILFWLFIFYTFIYLFCLFYLFTWCTYIFYFEFLIPSLKSHNQSRMYTGIRLYATIPQILYKSEEKKFRNDV